MTKRQKQIRIMLDCHIGILQHFIEEGGWPILGPSFHFDTLKSNPWLCRDDMGYLARTAKTPIPDDLLAAYWKLRFNEVNGDYNKLANAVDKLRDLI